MNGGIITNKDRKRIARNMIVWKQLLALTLILNFFYIASSVSDQIKSSETLETISRISSPFFQLDTTKMTVEQKRTVERIIRDMPLVRTLHGWGWFGILLSIGVWFWWFRIRNYLAKAQHGVHIELTLSFAVVLFYDIVAILMIVFLIPQRSFDNMEPYLSEFIPHAIAVTLFVIGTLPLWSNKVKVFYNEIAEQLSHKQTIHHFFCSSCKREYPKGEKCPRCGNPLIETGWCPICNGAWNIELGKKCPEHETTLVREERYPDPGRLLKNYMSGRFDE